MLLFAIYFVHAQYKNDNVLYKTVYTEDLCRELSANPGYLLLDVRSSGEYADTSANYLNVGRFGGAKNINVMDLPNHMDELYGYMNKPVFVYCSHSQRSRKASKMLADSGFTQVININGGMTGIRQLPAKGNECLFSKLVTGNGYSLISPVDLCQKLARNSIGIFLLDVRSDSAFNHNSKDALVNAYGVFKNTVHISLKELEASLYKVPVNKEIVITDLYGIDAGKAALILKKRNYSRVSVLTEGIDRFLNPEIKDPHCLMAHYISPVTYHIMSTIELKTFMDTHTGYLFLDVRTTDEFNNRSKNYWMNLGHLSGSVNIPAAQLDSNWEKITAYRTKPVILYAFSRSAIAYEAALTLTQKGFTQVYVLQGGIFNIGWTAANLKGYASLAKLRVDIPADNQ